MTTLRTASEWASILGVAGGFLTGCFYIVRWLVLWILRVNAITVNHVPHMEKMLRLICKKMKIDYTLPEEGE